MSQVFTPRRPSPESFGALAALDFGLRVRVEIQPAQRTLFTCSESVPVQELTSELAELVSSLRVRSFALRAELEHLVSALQVNVESGFWSLAEHAALDLVALLQQARRRRLADVELTLRAADAARHIADLCVGEVE